jgi:hypothetical protein
VVNRATADNACARNNDSPILYAISSALWGALSKIGYSVALGSRAHSFNIPALMITLLPAETELVADSSEAPIAKRTFLKVQLLLGASSDLRCVAGLLRSGPIEDRPEISGIDERRLGVSDKSVQLVEMLDSENGLRETPDSLLSEWWNV